ncbi:MAG: hypothetical protein ORN54_03060 [Cyclobacteriaceae bacterium]|nr:hypothetical protein [Cyclobacteriaceae bacterium]
MATLIINKLGKRMNSCPGSVPFSTVFTISLSILIAVGFFIIKTGHTLYEEADKLSDTKERLELKAHIISHSIQALALITTGFLAVIYWYKGNS